MATNVLTNCSIWHDGYDLSADSNKVGLQYGAEMLDDTVFGDTTRSRAGGLKSIIAQVEGFWNNADDGLDETLFGVVGTVDRVLTISPTGGAELEPAYAFQCAIGQYAPWARAEIGQLLGFSLRGESANAPLVRSTVMLNGAKTATGTGPIAQLGAVGATQKLYAALHVLSATGTTPSITARVQSAALVGFGSPTDRITFNAASAAGSQWAAPVSGPITDQFWRFSWTISGTTPVLAVRGIIGIL